MNTQKFLDTCNKSPLFKEEKPIGEAILKEVGLVHDEYSVADLLILKSRLSAIEPSIIYPKHKGFRPDKKWEMRHMLHRHILLLENNKKLIKKMREKLEMPCQNRGFILDPKNTFEKNFVNIVLDNQSQEYKNWIYHLIGKKNTDHISLKQRFELAEKVNRKIYTVAEYLLRKWDLPFRYLDSVIELVLFDRIIPADQNISFERKYDIYSNGTTKMSINFDKDTTKEELVLFIKQDSFGLFTGKRKVVSPNLKRNSRKDTETKEMREIYNQAKKSGSKDFQAIRVVQSNKKFSHLTLSAIRKRLKK